MGIHYINNLRIGKVVIVCFVLIGIVGVGCIIYKNIDKNDKLNADVTISKPIDLVSPSITSGLTTPNSIDEHNFLIPEFGIKMKLPDGLVGLKYSIDDSAPWGPVAFLTTSSLEKIDVDSQCTEPGPLGVIWLVPEEPSKISNSKVSNYKKVGISYVAYQHPQGLCSSNSNTIDLQMSQIELLQQAIDNIGNIK